MGGIFTALLARPDFGTASALPQFPNTSNQRREPGEITKIARKREPAAKLNAPRNGFAA